MFDDQQPCDNIHSQTRRMFMVSPESDFWIHAAIELGKSPKTHDTKGKTKKGSDVAKPEYDYYDSSINDQAVRTQLIRGYEMFKLKHGSFARILSELGQQALELQMERFFTPWAWTWDLTNRPDFGEHMGLSLHPLHSILREYIDEFDVRNSAASLLLSAPHVLPSSQFQSTYHTDSLARLLLPLVMPPPPNSLGLDDSARDKIKDAETLSASSSANSSSTFLGLPPITMNVPKLSWPAYLTFGKNPAKNLPARDPSPSADISEKQMTGRSDEDVPVDQSALQDAINSEQPSPSPSPPSEATEDSTEPEEPAQELLPPPPVISLSLYLAASQSSAETKRRVFLVKQDDLGLAIIPSGTYGDIPSELDESLLQSSSSLLKQIRARTSEEADSSPTTPQTVTKILQPKDRYLATRGLYTLPHPDVFTSRSEHLYNAQSIRLAHPQILEVFSRGQTPQHWHIAKGGLPHGESLYLEVGRKEASLADVDNTLAGLVNRSIN